MKKIICIVAVLAMGAYVLHHYKSYRDYTRNVEKYNQVVQEFNLCMEAFDWNCAEKNVRILLQEDPSDTVAQNNLAAILLEQERYGECISYVESLTRKSENLKFLKNKAALLQRELEELHLEQSFHFRLEYDGAPSRTNVMEALAVLEVAYDSISTLFQFEPSNKMRLVLYQADEHTGVGPRPDWVGAIYDGKLRVPENIMSYRAAYRPMLFHELTHSFVRGMTYGHVPQWINEGIAQVIDGSRRDVPNPGGPAPSLKDLSDSFVNEGSRDKAEKLYWYSQKMVEGMLRRNGSLVHFREFIQDLNRLGEKDALDRYYSVTAEQLLEEVR